MNFTTEQNGSGNLNYLDVPISQHNGVGHNSSFRTSVYRKPTNEGVYLPANSEYPDRYKESTIKFMINRACKISSLENFHHDIGILKQTFVNKGHSKKLFDKLLNQLKSRIFPSSRTAPTGSEDSAAGSKESATGSEDLATGSENLTTGSEDLATGAEDSAIGSEGSATGSEDSPTASEDSPNVAEVPHNDSEDSPTGMEDSPPIEDGEDFPAVAVAEDSPAVAIAEETPTVAVTEETPAYADAGEKFYFFIYLFASVFANSAPFESNSQA